MKIISIKKAFSITKVEKNNSTKLVQEIINQVNLHGDSALTKFEKKFNGVDIKNLQVTKKEISEAYKFVSKDQINAITMTKDKLVKTETALKKQLKQIKITESGTKITKLFVPLSSAGCYVPGGLARYPSSAIMSIVPAKIAGVEKIVMVTPPNKQGKIDPMVLVAADICGADLIFKVGGAHAIAALAYGTKIVPQVDKIVGPGGSFVTMAKYLVSDVVSIDMLAGPTELVILADDSANPKLVALDLISQAEHSSDTRCCLITTSQNLANKVASEITKIISSISRKEIVQSSLQKNGFIAVGSVSDAILLANKVAPEHIQIITKNPNNIAKQIKTAGLILIGQDTPSSASDYLLGTNHILPTNGFGRARGSLSVLDFLKIQTSVETTKLALKQINKHLKVLTESEDLPNHYDAVRGRL
ncbi:histidinol dehydrogenase [Candidatus Nitrosotenuis cloacae]|uniref:Histidinol dehydrogenase n=1 Tax=Candidatus Nitrosotenuis cloacae TaxID=1603555 RepID=A0A3G1B2F2_9ARCH|nr:histidinol dehydrogenase [Candidatus Nitrosotenuis cloacae]AJZ75766.1 histidinol dehydrogenase [Candidatus Nitrosotenuis cloacae]